MDKTTDAEINEFTLAISLLVRRIRVDAPAEMRQLSWTQKSILSRLDSEGPAISADLARAEGVKPQSMGTAVAALEEMGLVEKRPHPTDGRQFLVALTLRGKAMRKNTREAKEAWINGVISQLNKSEQNTLFRAGEIIKKMVEMS